MTQQNLLSEYSALPPEAQREVVDFVAFLRERYKGSTPPTNQIDIRQAPFIGMWKDREEMKDSTAWVRHLRETEWGRQQKNDDAELTPIF